MKMNPWISGLLTGALLLGLLSGCGQETLSSASAAEPASASEAAVSLAEAPEDTAEASQPEAEPQAEVYSITLNGDSIDAPEAQVEGSTVTITQGGTYAVSGSLTDGQIVVDAKGEDITLILEGAAIACSDSAPIYIKKAETAVIELAAGTENTVTDGADYVFAEVEDEPDAAIFSKADLILQGQGSLTVTGSYSMAVHSKDTLTVQGDGTYILSAVGDGLKGKDAVEITGGSLTITAGEDGIQSNNDTEGGDIAISGGTVILDAQGDGIKAEHSLTISGGTVSVTAEGDGLKAKNTLGDGVLTLSGGEITVDAQQDAVQSDGDLTVSGGVIDLVTLGGAANAPEHQGDFFGGPPGWFNDLTTDDESVSAKGLKCLNDMTITGGTVTIDSYDDAIHSDGTVTISGDPVLTIASGDDGIHANEHLTIEDGTIVITQSYEGLEGLFIDILGGDVTLTASDDGMNANGEEIFGPMGSMMGLEDTLEDADTYLHIAGGHIVVNASGDGLDSNGFLFVEGGEIYVSGPSNSMNGALDCGTSAQINGGTIIAIGASGMDETFGSASTQPSIKCTLAASLSGDSPVTLTDSAGNVLVEYAFDGAESKKYNSVVISSPELTVGETYTLTCGDETMEIELTDNVTTVRQTASGSPETSASGGFGFGGPGGFGGPPGGPPGR